MKKTILTLICLTTFLICESLSLNALSCSCSSYPCSTGTCSGDFCDGSDYVEYTGTCLSDGFGGGICEEDTTSCPIMCVDGFGCGECLTSNDCDADEYYCSGPNDRYFRNYYCNPFTYTCEFDEDFVEDCNDYDGNYCNGQLRELRNYFCSLGFCDYGVTTTTDCSVYTTSWSDWYCLYPELSYRERDLGVCDLDSFYWCDTVLDTQSNICTYGCATSSNEKEYRYECDTINTYRKYEREIEGYCRKESDISWSLSGFGETLTCSENYICENDLIISSGTPINPCEAFGVSVTLNQTTIRELKDFTVQSTSDQSYVPNVLMYDYTNDGIFDKGFGSQCNSTFENLYCDSNPCCDNTKPYNTVHTITTSSTGNYKLRTIGFETNQDLYFSQLNDYTVSSAFIIAEIDSGNLVINISTSYNLDDNSFGDPGPTAQCWKDNGYRFYCYGDSSDCSEFCPGYDYINAFWQTDFPIRTSQSGTRTIELLTTNGNQTDTDTITVCVFDYDNDVFCGTCNDGIQNDDEIGVDFGGHCGTCYDGIQNGIETYIDYGGNCGTCFDGVRQTFELIDIDYGGICGNCTGIKDKDTYWQIGHDVDGSIPFDYSYCGESTNAILGVIQILVIGILGSLFIFIFIALGILIVLTIFISGTIGTLITALLGIVNRRITTITRRKKFK